MKRAGVLCLTLLTFPFSLWALKPEFSVVDLAPDERLLFSVRTDQPGWGEFSTLFMTDLIQEDSIRALTHFPERTRYFPSAGELEIQNRFGLYRMAVEEGAGIRRFDPYPSFALGHPVSVGAVLPVSSSPDGRWIVLQEPEDAVRGGLVLYDSLGGSRYAFAPGHILNYKDDPVLWSPDSRYLIYSREGMLYYLSIRHTEEERVPDESYRELGQGTLKSVSWTGADALYYVNGSSVDLIRPSEFFTRSFYADPLPAGHAVGRLPVMFNPNFDAFWPSPNGEFLILMLEERNLFCVPLDVDDAARDGMATALPFLLLPRDATVRQLWWRSDSHAVFLTGGSRRDSSPSRLYTLDVGGEVFEQLDLDGVSGLAASPDGSQVAVLLRDGVSIRRSMDFKQQQFLSHTDPRSLYWISSQRLLICGSEYTEMRNLMSSSGTVLAMSSADKAAFRPGDGVQILIGSRVYFTKADRISRESSADAPAFPEGRTVSERHRIYTEILPVSSAYANRIMVRKVRGFGNYPLFPVPERGPLAGEAGDDAPVVSAHGTVFEHGVRFRGRKVALVFNAVDNDVGLGEVLATLADYRIRSTFFVGGDFIRRQPGSAVVLARSGHEIGSLFYTHMDMTDFRYRIDADFVMRGLGRNEDEYHRATGFEVSTLWHAPWYVVSPAILEATERMGYLYVGRDVDPLDWVVFDESGETSELYADAPDLVERTLAAAAPGSIIPIRIGRPGPRKDYFFRYLDSLINGLLERGFEILTVGELWEQSR